jgi:hypothetical protein
MMEAGRTSETLVNLYQTTRCYNPEDSNLQRKSFTKFLIGEMKGVKLTQSGQCYVRYEKKYVL